MHFAVWSVSKSRTPAPTTSRGGAVPACVSQRHKKPGLRPSRPFRQSPVPHHYLAQQLAMHGLNTIPRTLYYMRITILAKLMGTNVGKRSRAPFLNLLPTLRYLHEVEEYLGQTPYNVRGFFRVHLFSEIIPRRKLKCTFGAEREGYWRGWGGVGEVLGCVRWSLMLS